LTPVGLTTESAVLSERTAGGPAVIAIVANTIPLSLTPAIAYPPETEVRSASMKRPATSPSSSSSPSPAERNWSLLVYLAGDNNLSADMVWSVQEIEKASRDPKLRKSVVLSVLFDPAGANPRRYDFVSLRDTAETDDAHEGSLDELPGLEYPEGVSARQMLDRFLVERVPELPPTTHRLVVLSGHGSGAAGDFLVDDDPKSALSLRALGKAVDWAKSAGAPIDVLGLDSCEMSGIEVAYQLRRSVKYLIASEGLVFDAGWPYYRVVQSIAGRSKDTPLEVARQIARRYLAFYRDYELVGLSTDVSVTDLERIEPVASSARALARAMTAPLSRLAPEGIEEAIELGGLERSPPDPGPDAAQSARTVRNAILLAHWSAQAYRGDRYADLFDFVEQLLRFSSGQSGEEILSIRSAGAAVLEAIRSAVRYSGSTGADFQHSHGLSIYFPWSDSEYLPDYRRLEFAKFTGWADFLEVYFAATRRMRRHQLSRLKPAEGGHGLALDAAGKPVVPMEPRRSPDVSLPTKDVDSGTHKDVDSGTHKGEASRSTMKNPPGGYYHSPDDDKPE
jgi:Clostripain family